MSIIKASYAIPAVLSARDSKNICNIKLIAQSLDCLVEVESLRLHLVGRHTSIGEILTDATGILKEYTLTSIFKV